ncbi:UDP-N-acetylmuramate dehydrogenase [Patescibacteria group bacterium]
MKQKISKKDKFSTRFENKIKKNINLSDHTTLKIGGPAENFMIVKSTDEMIDAVILARHANIPVFIIGGGSNILVGDKGIEGLVIKNNSQAISIRGAKGVVNKNHTNRSVYVEVDSGVFMNQLVRFTVSEGLKGLEMHLGLPGTVGGAIYMNSKWTKPVSYVGDVLYQARILTPKNEIKIVPRSYFKFKYDYSYLQDSGDILLSCIFCLSSASKKDLWKTANDSMEYRKKSQPFGVFSAGCIFKNYNSGSSEAKTSFKSAGKLIDQMGFKGKKCGDAYVSSRHANFIINKKKARACDMLELITDIKKSARKNGVKLDEEIIKVGKF